MVANRRKGYLAALIGAIFGASLIMFFVLFIAGAYITKFAPNYAEITVPITIILMLGTALGEVLGCWLALRLLQYHMSGRTAAILTGLIVPGCLFFLIASRILGSILATAIVMLSLPLIARALTYDPNFPDYLFRITHVFAKRR